MINPRNPVMLGLLMLAASTRADSAQTLEKVIGLEQQSVKEAQASQKQIDVIVNSTEKLFEEYKQVNKQILGLKVYNAQVKKQIDNQEQHLMRLASSMDQASLMERQISPLIQKMLYSLDKFVDLDLPFHLDERRQRINQLLANQDRADLSVAERFRQVLEAYKIEIEFGRTMDTYRQVIDLNGEEREVTILRIGRISLLFQTPDKKLAGFWDQNENAWQEMGENHYRAAISQGIRMAKKQVSLDIMTIPVQAAEILK
jgi:galactitol-specific phosphotransferase system IIB component